MNTENPQPPPSPMHPVAPPTKKQRSIQPPMRGGRDALSTAADDAIARRRAELRRLQERRTQQQHAKGLLDQARSQLGSAGPPMPPQQPHHVARARHSDIFPNVAKSVATPSSNLRPTPRVARRLDPAFEEKRSRSKSAPPMRAPPPPVPPPLVAEAPPERPSPSQKTPSHQQQQEPTPGTARRETLRNLRDMAGSEDIQLVRELKLAQDGKADALRTIARLKEQIQQLQKPQVMSPQQEQAVSQVTFLSPLNASATPSRGSRSASSPALLGSCARKRVPTPHPKRNKSNEQDGTFLKEAANSIPYEYTSTLATYIVRRPHITSSQEEDFWNSATCDYHTVVNVNKPPTLEVAAKITADGSILTLSGVSTVRHKNSATQEWKVFENVDDMDKPLGCVMYIDSDASEKEYWLDTIYEEAFAAREAYCSSLISAAAVLQARKAEGPTNPGVNLLLQQQSLPVTAPEKQHPVVADACVGTEDFNVDDKEKPAAAPPANKPKPEASKPPPKQLEEESSSGDLLSVVLGMMFSSIFGLVWLVLVRIPFKIFTFSLLVVTASALISIIWFYLKDDHGALEMGAEMQYGFNKPGIV